MGNLGGRLGARCFLFGEPSESSLPEELPRRLRDCQSHNLITSRASGETMFSLTSSSSPSPFSDSYLLKEDLHFHFGRCLFGTKISDRLRFT